MIQMVHYYLRTKITLNDLALCEPTDITAGQGLKH